MFWLWGPSSIPWGLRGEIIKVLSEMRKWSLLSQQQWGKGSKPQALSSVEKREEQVPLNSW